MITKLREKFKINRKYLKCKISLNAMLIGIDYINIGINTTILYGTRIQAVSIWKNRRYTPNIVIGRNVNIEQGVHITCANEVIIEDNVSLLPYCMITDIKHDYENIKMAPNKQGITVKKTIIKEQSSIGFGACIMPGIVVGKHVVVGANSVVTDDVPDYCVVAGIPAQIIKRYNFDNNKWE